MSNIAIKVENLGKLYRLGEVGTGTLSHDLNRWWARMRGKEDPFAKIGETNDRTIKGNSDYVWSLKDINFEVKSGEVLGIIGRNGAGKSTLLKLLSKVTSPTVGRIKVNGRIASLLEVGTGFHPELTGRENIFLNGAILGMSKAEIRSKFDEIVDFSGVERYIDTPVKRYSSGMYVRLAFAVSAFLEPEILIVDEVLAVGDAEFQKKCLGRMKDVSVNDGRTVLFVSHNMGAVAQLCTKGLLMKNGGLHKIGDIQEVLNEYLRSNTENASSYANVDIDEKPIQILKAGIVDAQGNECSSFAHNQEISIYFDLKNVSTERGLVCSLGLQDFQERRIFTEQININPQTGYQKHKITLPINLLRPNNFKVSIALHIPNVKVIEILDCLTFEIIDVGSEFSIYGNVDNGVIFPKLNWLVLNE
ncbi:ABC transporter ATP-binding protein [Adhaeribacter rhizoryzae]|uniref:ABC transporter ATP-binding protein n=1 Tax=Adhaeribacter rhizoryzae TaxID=2607907 RepID=A0A5M6DQ26_9BACT|nr:ABC transporter ATP-binding protein [Adhaeribacter rhizoryzae]KAA5548329.1 ABC transporter ATP-binding protein [Adhaeribacter rhizoryzae]